MLRETAQAPRRRRSFRDFPRWRFYNTNNLWIDLERARGARERDGVLDLPLIVNRKTVDPADPALAGVIQLETAMGAAIGAFEGAARGARARARASRPVKTTDDLLVAALRRLRGSPTTERVEPAAARRRAPFVELDPAHYRRLADFERRFPHGPPSLAGCQRFVVRGDASFAA